MSTKRTSSKNRKGIRSMTRSAVERAAFADPDGLPLTAADLKRMKRTPRIKIIRRALGLTQEEFSARYRIPLGTLVRPGKADMFSGSQSHRGRSQKPFSLGRIRGGNEADEAD